MTDRFDWNSESTKIARLYGDLAIYANSYGDIVLRQHGSATDEDDPFVVIPRSLVSWAIAAIEDEAKQVESDLESEDQESSPPARR